MAPHESEPRRGWASTLPWVVMIAGDALAVWRGYLAAWWYRRWLNDRVFDPSGSELSYLNARIEATLTALAVGVAAIGLALVLRARRREARPRLEGDGI